MTPQISVVMTVYNGENYLSEAIESILNQTFTDFEFIIIDDGSIDRTAQIIASYTDPRIVRVKNNQNLGVTISLNKGIALAQGEYIARMDADDISLPNRFERQVAYLDNHFSIGVLGTAYKLINEQGQVLGSISKPTQPGIVKWTLLFRPPLAHPSVMMRTDTVKKAGGYSVEYPFAQDYDLWARLRKYTDLSNLSDCLLLYRSNSHSISIKNNTRQIYYARQIQRLLLAEYIGMEDAEFLVDALHQGKHTDFQAIRSAELIYSLFIKFLDSEQLSGIAKQNLRNIVGYKIYNLVSPFKYSLAANLWFLRALFLAPNIILILYKRYFNYRQ